MKDLSVFEALIPADHGLCVISTMRADATIQSSVVNAGVLAHPSNGTPVVGLVAAGGSIKLRHLRLNPRATVVVRAGWQWAAVEGTAQLLGPDDQNAEIDAAGLRSLLREVFRSAGGTHDDWDAYDRVMAEERRTVVLITPARVYSNRST